MAAAPAAAMEFSLPLACTPGSDCAVQNYVDRDPGPDAVDFDCGHQTYDGHDATDIRIRSLKAMGDGVPVLAAAAGTVTAIRDGMPDVSIRESGAGAVANRECGNGVIIDHADGWTTQYCHMKEGSIRVKVGDRVTAGTPIGEVGLSGATEFPHVHFEVTHAGKGVDPFAPATLAGGACTTAGDAAGSLWSADARSALAYRPAFVLSAGFADRAVAIEEAESGALEDLAVPANAPALVFWGLAIGLETGDRQKVEIVAPDGGSFVADEIEPLDRPKAQYFAFAGRKLRDAAWPAGTYTGRYSVIRDGRTIATREVPLTIGPP